MDAGHTDAIVSRGSFEEAAAAATNGDADAVWLPVHNNLAGDILDAAAAIEGWEELERHGMAIRHHLLGRPDADPNTLEVVYGHPAALAQCESTLASMGLTAVPASDSATAAQRAQEDSSIGAIAGEAAAGIFGLNVLRHDVQDAACVTTFVLARPRVHK